MSSKKKTKRDRSGNKSEVSSAARAGWGQRALGGFAAALKASAGLCRGRFGACLVYFLLVGAVRHQARQRAAGWRTGGGLEAVWWNQRAARSGNGWCACVGYRGKSCEALGSAGGIESSGSWCLLHVIPFPCAHTRRSEEIHSQALGVNGTFTNIW